MKKKDFKYLPIEDDAFELLALLRLQTNTNLNDVINAAINCFSAYANNEDIRKSIDNWLLDEDDKNNC